MNFFTIFFRIFLAGVEEERNSGLNFFFLFLGISHPGLFRNSVKMMFFNFLNFLAIFFGNGNPARVGTEFGTKIFSLSWPLSTLLDRNYAGIKFLIF